MIEFLELTEIKTPVNDFLKNALEFNINFFAENPQLNSSYNGFYAYMEGLAKFGQMIQPSDFFISDNQIKIYKQTINIDFYNRLKFHAIDSTGLSHGFIYGPFHEKIGKIESFNRIQDLFYGYPPNEKCLYEYDCVVKMDVTNHEESRPVNLDILRKNYLPLMKGGNDLANLIFRYYKVKNPYNVKTYGPTIYQSDSRSFYLPFEELIRNTLQLEDRTLRITPKFEKEFISFEAIYSWRTRKYNHLKTWSGKITYDKFDIIVIDLINEESEYDW